VTSLTGSDGATSPEDEAAHAAAIAGALAPLRKGRSASLPRRSEARAAFAAKQEQAYDRAAKALKELAAKAPWDRELAHVAASVGGVADAYGRVGSAAKRKSKSADAKAKLALRRADGELRAGVATLARRDPGAT
jgi:hypothetical protein